MATTSPSKKSSPKPIPTKGKKVRTTKQSRARATRPLSSSRPTPRARATKRQQPPKPAVVESEEIIVVEEQPVEIVATFVASEPTIIEQPRVVSAPVSVEEYFLAGVITVVLFIGGFVGQLFI